MTEEVKKEVKNETETKTPEVKQESKEKGTTNKGQETKQDSQEQQNSEFKGTSKKEQDIEKFLKEELPLEREDKDRAQRFGYFSIPYPSTIGDQAYSRNAEYHHKVVDRKVITENRGIYVQGPKSGKGPDVYFPPPESTEKLIAQKEKDEKNREEKEKKRKEQEIIEKAKLKERNPFKFKPAGPQIAFSFYKKLEDAKPLPERVLPLTIEPDKKKYKIDHFKVKTEVRNVQAAPTRSGTHPNDYFGYYRAEDEIQKKLEDMNKQDIEDKIKKVKESKTAPSKISFKPASLKLCEPFANDKKTYFLHDDKEMEDLLKQYKEDKKKGNERYKKPPNPVHHDKPFSPARMMFEGRAGLFMYKSEDYYLNKDIRYTKEYQKEKKEKEKNEKKIPIREIREKENQEKKAKFGKPFTYNKLVKSSTFAPPISSYMVNIKRDFPSIKFH